MPGLRDVARATFHLPDRILHPLQRRRLERRLRREDVPDTLLFVCLGNICRSPYAEKAFERASAGWSRSPRAVSAGFVGPDRPSPETAREVAQARGVDLSGHRSRQLTGDLLAAATVVFVMEPVQRKAIRRKTGRDDVHLLGDLDPQWAGRRAIRDPVEQPREVFEEVFERIDRIVERLAWLLSGEPERIGDAAPP